MKYTNFSISRAEAGGYFRISKGSSRLTVPEAKPYDPSLDPRNLTVPHKDEPAYGTERIGQGFCGNTSFFRCSDGTIVDFKIGKVVYQPNKQTGYWRDPSKVVGSRKESEWKSTPTIDQIIASAEQMKNSSPQQFGLSEEDIKYWKIAEEESKKLEQSLTDEQKHLLKDLADGKIFTPSKLELED